LTTALNALPDASCQKWLREVDNSFSVLQSIFVVD
jgi:hypothetical protein